MTTTTKNTDDFIMLPTVDYCFGMLMKNSKVRKGFSAAILHISPDEIEETTLLPTILHGNSSDRKTGIFDVRILLKNGTQINMEMQVAPFDFWEERSLFYLGRMFTEQLQKGDEYSELKKCIHVSILNYNLFPADAECYHIFHFYDKRTDTFYTDKMEIQVLELKKLAKNLECNNDIYAWMKFFSRKNRKEFAAMAKENEYIDEAYDELLKLSADDIKRLQYETREKALRDYNSQISNARRHGFEDGEKIGQKHGEERVSRLINFLIKEQRYEDIERATTNDSYRQMLYTEFHIE